MQIYLANLGAIISLILGLVAIISPSIVESFVSIRAIEEEGRSEVRATYGGFFAGISLFVLVIQSHEAFIALGTGWCCAAFVRLMTLPFGRATIKNISGVVFEGAIGFLCLSVYFS